MPSGSSCHPNPFWLDSMTPDSTVMKNANESLVDELGLCANLSQMYISNQQDNTSSNKYGFSGPMDSPRHRRQLINDYYDRGSQAPDPTAFFRSPVVDVYAYMEWFISSQIIHFIPLSTEETDSFAASMPGTLGQGQLLLLLVSTVHREWIPSSQIPSSALHYQQPLAAALPVCKVKNLRYCGLVGAPALVLSTVIRPRPPSPRNPPIWTRISVGSNTQSSKWNFHLHQ